MNTHSRTLRLTAAAASVALLLSACSGQQIVAEEAVQSGQAAQNPNLDAARIAEILKDTQALLVEADKAFSVDTLKERFSDPALRMRAAQYALAQKKNTAAPVLDLTEQALSVTNSTTWPRVVVDISKEVDGKLPSAYFFVQDDARSGYKLQNWTRLLGSSEVKTLTLDTGAAYVEASASGYRLTPEQAVDDYVTMLNSGTAGSDSFATDEFTNLYFSQLKSLNDSAAAAGTVTATAARLEDAPVTAVRLSDGSALVASAITFTHTYARTVAQSKLNLGGDPALLAGDPAIVGNVEVKYLLTVLIRVPAQGSDQKAQLIGAERALESVTKNDAARPQGE